VHRFWSRFSGPIIETVAPRRLLEVGAEFGWNSRNLLEYCVRSGSFLDIVEPMPLQSLRDQLEPYGPEHYALHVAKSLECIPGLESPDLVMLDGDHNWRTVYSELSLLRTNADSRGKTMPIVLAHDCAWPYARRDMYYDPEAFSEGERHPYAYKGILPGVPGLVDNGINEQFANAHLEGGPENGVLTAIEDFVAANPGHRLWTLPFFNGFGIIVPEERLTPELLALIEGFYSGESMLETCKALEADAMRVRAEMLADRRVLEQRSDALDRARALLARRTERIAELEKMLGSKASA
jgi:hypothetical protein